jgi:hypothetical protein
MRGHNKKEWTVLIHLVLYQSSPLWDGSLPWKPFNNCTSTTQFFVLIFMKSPKPYQVCRLKQVSFQWFAKLYNNIYQFLGIHLIPIWSFYIFQMKLFSFTLLLVYVDDVILSGTSIFEVEGHGPLKYIIGLEVDRSININRPLTFFIAQVFFGVKPCPTALTKDLRKLDANSPAYEFPSEYRRLLGRLFYILLQQDPISATACELRYVKVFPSQDLFFSTPSELKSV